METYSNSHYNRLWTDTLLNSGFSQSTKDLTLKYLNDSETWNMIEERSKTMIELKKSSQTENEFTEKLTKQMKWDLVSLGFTKEL